MENLIHYSDSELSLRVLNEEGLYSTLMRSVGRGDFSILLETINEIFIYDEEQLEDLRETWAEEVMEYNNEA